MSRAELSPFYCTLSIRAGLITAAENRDCWLQIHLFKSPSCCLYTCHCPDSSYFWWLWKSCLKDSVGKRQVCMTKEPKDNCAMSWAWVKVSRSNFGSDLLSTTLVQVLGQRLPGQRDHPVPHSPRRTQQIGLEAAQPSLPPLKWSSQRGLTITATERDLGVNLKCGIFQAARKRDWWWLGKCWVWSSHLIISSIYPSSSVRGECEAIILSSWVF